MKHGGAIGFSLFKTSNAPIGFANLPDRDHTGVIGWLNTQSKVSADRNWYGYCRLEEECRFPPGNSFLKTSLLISLI